MLKKRDYFTKYADKAKMVLETLLEKYADEVIENLESLNILKVQPFNDIGSPMEIVGLFGGKIKYLSAVIESEKELYEVA